MSKLLSEERQSVVIVGAGLAGFNVASALVQRGYVGEVTLVGDEPWQPYDRPPLSKQLQLDGDESQIWLSPELPPKVKQLRQRKAMAIDPQRKALRLDDGSTLPWDRLVLATGTRPLRLAQLDGLPRVLTLRTLGDARAIREALTSVASLLVIGGGPIGLELAASAAALGRQSTVVEKSPRLMSRSAPAAMADVLLEHHRRCGIAIHLSRTVVALDEGTQEAVLDDGQRNPVTGRFERIETWANAQGQAQALAAIWCNPSEAKAYDAVPWFWSDQGSARLQCAGALTGEQQAWRVDAAGGRVLVHWSGGLVTGVATLNATRDFGPLKKLIVPRATITPEQFSAPEANIRALVQQALAA